MFKRFIFAVFAMFVCVAPVTAAQIVNVDYVHKIIDRKMTALGATKSMKINAENIYAAANMKYLLTAVDVANEMLNGEPTTSYGTGEYATTVAADTVAANTAAETLIKKLAPFRVITTPGTTSFSFSISAAGDFTVDWGDGTIQPINRTNTDAQTYSHTYTSAGTYTIGIDGQATGYSTSDTVAAISFYQNAKLASIAGFLGHVFPTIGDGSASGQQPRFYRTFSTCANLAIEIPAALFDGIHGQPTSNMFCALFYDSAKVAGQIPEKLFSGVVGAPTAGLFYSTFHASGVSGQIPEKLFSGIKGQPAPRMFRSTFNECSKINGTIPEKLFAGISGAPAANMFTLTFAKTSVTGPLPAELFAGIEGAPAAGMYEATFRWCYKLSGSIPSGFFGKIKGAPASTMYLQTFFDCRELTGPIPENLFGDLSGPAAYRMFGGVYTGAKIGTFSGCKKLSGPSAKINGKYLYEIWPDATREQVGDCYDSDTELDDYADIPDNWK